MNRLSHKVRFTHGKDGGIVLDLQSGQVFRLNPIGVWILKAVESGKSQPEIIRELAGNCNTNEETIRPDVLSFLRALEKRELIEVCDSLEGLK